MRQVAETGLAYVFLEVPSERLATVPCTLHFFFFLKDANLTDHQLCFVGAEMEHGP